MKRHLIVFLILVSCNQLFATENKHWVWDFTSDKTDFTIKAVRKMVAQNLENDLKGLGAYLPSLTPGQIKWLEKERSSMNELSGSALDSKMRAFMISSEYQLENAHSQLKLIVENLTLILHSNLTLNQELYLWAHINLLLTDSNLFNDAIKFLYLNKTVDFNKATQKQFHLGAILDNPWSFYDWIGRFIQDRIVLALISEKL